MPEVLTAIVLALTVLLACARLLQGHLRRDRTQPAPRWKLTLLLMAQPLLAALLFFGLFPPARPLDAGVMTVYTAGANPAAADADTLRIALPEAPAHTGTEPAPDLATALRRHPGIRGLRIVGSGLDVRDVDAARGLPLRFHPAPRPAGIVDLQAPTTVAPGNAFRVRGRIGGIEAGTLELLDPAVRVIARTPASADGSFALQGVARSVGAFSFQLRLRDAKGQVRDSLPLPLQVIAPAAPRLLVLAGAPDPELKYLRRWALDAGVGLHTRVSVGAGLVLGDAPVALDDASLRRFDAVLLDTRSLQALGDAELRALTRAVRDGLGLLLRLDVPLSPVVRARLRGWGYTVDAGNGNAAVQLANTPLRTAGETTALPGLGRTVAAVQAGDALPLLRDVQAQPLAWWRPLGRGRVGLVALTDSYRLPLAGHAAVHARLWSDLLAGIARSTTAATPAPPAGPIWTGQRALLCGVEGNAAVIAPDGNRMALAIDPASGARSCAAFWPRIPGWHRLQARSTQTAFAVLPADAGLAWQAQRRFDATMALAAQSPTVQATRSATTQRGATWPWLAGWLMLAVLAWWLERRRASPQAR
ncbi:carboxypeptidase regulatory-like domain-containing protein [Thermomonas fusca]|uniref:Carboxypeptidase regulatory-like domain-containing protein n=1 Tax=Thermomonas fusca TaxID=215690 RepID=A0A5R9PFS4_9GAMM|nr:carboxypeptidase regulatory-like domain-containing protein [Thermomonas fusca]TLX22369.1 carboxypeptidase regulatory-like domain-containing protein [Thermomonas fusca]